jgi:hyperosmotically inducible periplasmic protein
MVRRSIAALVLLLVVAVGAYVWWDRSGSRRAGQPAARVPAEARELGAEAREGARELGAEAKKGVRALGAEASEKLREAGHALRDAKLTASVKTALGLNRSLRPYSLDVRSEDGAVTLSGRVNTQEERAQAGTVAAAVPDVTRVVNQIQAGGRAAASSGRSLGERFDDEKIEVGVRLALSLNRELRGTDVTVQSYRGEVTLGGEVSTEAQHQQALQTARDTASVTKVVDHVRVRSAAPGGDASAAERAAAAQHALRSNPHLAGFDLQVREEGDRLVLRGAVRTPVEKDLAVAIAREAAGGNVEDAVEVRADAEPRGSPPTIGKTTS